METVFERFWNIRNNLNENTILDEMHQYFSANDILGFVEHLESTYYVNFK